MQNEFEQKVDRSGTACIKWDFQEMDFGRSGLLPFSIADADYAIHAPVLDALKKRIDNGVLGYSDLDDGYMTAVCDWCRTRHGWDVKKEWITSTNGIVPSMFYAIEVFTKPADPIIVQPPVYDPFYSIIRATGREIVKNDLVLDETGYHMNLEQLERQMAAGAKMMLLCSPHNPVCRVWTREELKQVADLCIRYNVLLVSDEIHWDLILGDGEHTTMGAFEELYGNLIVCISASKTFNIAGLEASNIIIPCEKLRQQYQGWLFARYLFCANTLGMEATKVAYQTGAAWVDAQLAHLKKNAQLLQDFFRENLPEAKIARVEGTYLLWVDLRYLGKTSDELVKEIAAAGAGVNSGEHYGEDYDGFIRINIACPSQQLKEGLDCILKAVKK